MPFFELFLKQPVHFLHPDRLYVCQQVFVQQFPGFLFRDAVLEQVSGFSLCSLERIAFDFPAGDGREKISLQGRVYVDVRVLAERIQTVVVVKAFGFLQGLIDKGMHLCPAMPQRRVTAPHEYDDNGGYRQKPACFLCHNDIL